MERKQFYPSAVLAKCLADDAQARGISESLLIIDILEEYYCLKSENEPSIPDLTRIVLDEVAEYVQGLPLGEIFDLATASESYKKIAMTKGRKPQFVRASIGRSFAGKIGKDRFANVRKAIQKNKHGVDTPVLSENNALMYEKF